MVEVQVRFNNVDFSLKILKKKLQREGVFKVMREKKDIMKSLLRKNLERVLKQEKGNINLLEKLQALAIKSLFY